MSGSKLFDISTLTTNTDINTVVDVNATNAVTEKARAAAAQTNLDRIMEVVSISGQYRSYRVFGTSAPFTLVFDTEHVGCYVKATVEGNLLKHIGVTATYEKQDPNVAFSPNALVAVTAFKAGLALYGGNDNTMIAAANTWLGRPAEYQTIFFNQTSWANFESSIGYIADFHKSRYNLWSVPLAAEYGTLPQVVAGTHDAKFLACAKAMLAAAQTGQPANSPILTRIGWEFNLLGQQQRAFDGNGVADPTRWVASFRRIVNIFRSVSKRFKFIWCTNNGDMTENGLTLTDCWPGDTYVDYVAADLYYDSTYSNPAPSAGVDTFGYDRDRSGGLNWLASFAAAHNKPLMIPEWGCNSDLATGWFSSMINWMNTNNVVLQGYWNSDAAIATKLSDGAKPALAAQFIAAYGPPVITTSSGFDGEIGLSTVVQLSANRAATWSIVSGATGAFTLSGSTLTLLPQSSAGTYAVVVRAQTSDGRSVTKTITATVQAVYVYTNSEASAYVARMTAAPQRPRKQLIDQLFTSLKSGAMSSSNILNKLDTLYLFASHNS